MNGMALIPTLLALVFAPLMLGVVNRVKAMFAGRRGQPLLQTYYDLWKLLHKGAVYSRTTSWLFRAGPVVGLAAVGLALTLVPLGGFPAFVSFRGDLILFAGLLGLARFCTVIAAMDTGSSFEGMGASREVHFAALTEPALLVAFAALARATGSLSLTGIFTSVSAGPWFTQAPAVALLFVALVIVLLAENSRIPVDDPNTHLELTMIHEVMVLDHSGPDFAAILYGSVLKLWVLAALAVGTLPAILSGEPWLNLALALGMMFLIAVVVGIVESIMARLRLLVVPQLLVGAGALAVVAFILILI